MDMIAVSTSDDNEKGNMSVESVDEKEDEGEKGILTRAWSFLKSQVFDNIPSEEVKALWEKEEYFAFWILATLCSTFSLALFAYFFTAGLTESSTTTFISLDADAGICEPVGNDLVLSTFASRKGSWMGNEGFFYRDAKYSFQFNGLSGVDYKEFMTDMQQNVINPLGALSAQRPLHKNLMAWFHWTHLDYRPDTNGNNVLTRVELTGASSALWGNSEFTALARMDDCNEKVYDRSTNTFKFSWIVGTHGDLTTISLSSHFGQADPNGAFNYIGENVFGYNMNYVVDFSITLNVEAIMVASAINSGVTEGLNLELSGVVYEDGVSYQFYAYNDNEVDFYQGQKFYGYVDPQHPNMAPIYCNYILGTPIADRPANAYCYNDLYGKGNLCLPAFMPYQTGCWACGNSCPDQLDVFLMCIATTYENMKTLFALPGTYTNDEIYKDLIYDRALYNGDYAWCDTADGNCIDVTINAFGNDKVQGVNMWGMQLRPDSDETAGARSIDKAHCADSISVPDATWNLLIDEPAMSLYQQFYECREDTWNAIFNAFGVAAANASLMGSILVTITLLIWGNLPEYIESKRDVVMTEK